MTNCCITIHEDNLSAISMAESLKFAPHTKHIAIKYHPFYSKVQTSFNKSGDIKLKKISNKQQLANIFTKPVDNEILFKLWHMSCGWWLILILLCFQGSVEYLQCKWHLDQSFKLIELMFLLAHNSSKTRINAALSIILTTPWYCISSSSIVRNEWTQRKWS